MKQNTLRIAEDLALPLDAVTQTIGTLAKRRAGKSYFARRLSEQLFKAGQQVVIADPKGDHWGIRSAADGKSPGLPIIILGGEHGDVPLEVGGGEVVAKLVVEERVSAMLDLSLFRKHEVATFMTAFLENLYRLKAREQYRTPMMLVIDEADAIAPQRPMKGEERMLGAAEDIVRRGGQRGIGCTLVTQRAAVLNKNVLTQVQMLVALRTIAPQDLDALNAWIDVHGTDEERATLMESLPALPTGDAWFWSPGWPTTDGIFQRGHVLPIETFDSGATPKPGEHRIQPKRLADVDLDALKRQMTATIERAKENDPRELKKQIAELRKLASSRAAPAPKAERLDPEKFRAAVKKEADRALAKALRPIFAASRKAKNAALDAFKAARGVVEFVDAVIDMTEQIEKAGVEIPTAAEHSIDARARAARELHEARRVVPPRPTPTRGNGHDESSDLPAGERAVLTAVVQCQEGATREYITIMTGYKRSTRDLYLQALSRRGFIFADRDRITATGAGDAALPDFKPLPTGQELLEWWRQRLPPGELAILDAAVESWPKPAEREAISEKTGYKRSTRDLYIQQLARRRLVNTSRSGITASSQLFSSENA